MVFPMLFLFSAGPVPQLSFSVGPTGPGPPERYQKKVSAGASNTPRPELSRGIGGPSFGIRKSACGLG